MHELFALGFGPYFEAQLSSLPPSEPPLVPARIAAEHRGGYEVWASAAEGPAQLSGRLRFELQRDERALPGVGDWVLLSEPPHPGRTALVEGVLARRTAFTRGSAGREAREQVIAANVDLVFAVCGLDADYNVRRIERYLARIRASGAEPVVILSKADLCEDVAARLAELERRCPGVPLHATSAPRAEGLEAVRARLGEGTTVALVGSSGAGKSTLVNALLGEDRMATGAVRERDGRGCHVTTHRQLVRLPGGGVLVDTPGMRELQLAGDEGLDEAFGDLAALAAGCRYRDCRHAGEPGCAVRAAVEAGALDPERLAHYQQLEREAASYAVRHDVRLRREAERAWGKLTGGLKDARRFKGRRE